MTNKELIHWAYDRVRDLSPINGDQMVIPAPPPKALLTHEEAEFEMACFDIPFFYRSKCVVFRWDYRYGGWYFHEIKYN